MTTTNPYAVEGPALISYSGGRTSGYMLRHVLDAFDNKLPDDVLVVFADTHKERDETYDFVRETEERWKVKIHWVERPGGFEQLITDRKYLPNPVTRFCTQELKVRVMRDFMRSQGHEHWDMVVGIRWDERHRSKRLHSGAHKERWDYEFPMVDAKVTEQDVMRFWADSPFDLQLGQYEGNCDLCFLKGTAKKIKILMARPDLADWWIAQEKRIGATFRNGRWTYPRLLREANEARKQLHLPLVPMEDDTLGDCLCGD